MTRVTKDKGSLRHDDSLDALAGAVSYWVDFMAQDVDYAAQQAAMDALQGEYEAFYEAIGEDGFSEASYWLR